MNTCATEHYEFAGAYQCEFIMSRDQQNEFGNPVNKGGAMQFYSCKYTAGSNDIQPSCAWGAPTGYFIDGLGRDLRRIPGGVREYTCQVVEVVN